MKKSPYDNYDNYENFKRESNPDLKLVGKLRPVKALIPRWLSRIIFTH